MARPVERIEPLLDKIKELWLRNPDLRLCQLIYNLTRLPDSFHVEDDALLELVDDKLNNS